MNVLIVFTGWLLRIMLLWTFAYKFLSEHISAVLLSICLEIKLLDYMVTTCLTFWRTATGAAPFYIPISSICVFWSLHFFINTWYYPCIFIIAILVGINWYLIMTLIFISLMTNGIKHLFMCLLPLSFLEKFLFRCFAHFKWVFAFLLLNSIYSGY